MRYSLIFFTLFAIGVSCTPKEETKLPTVELSWTAEPTPLVVGPTQFDIQLTYPDGKPFDASEIELEANMTHPGMIPVKGVAERIDVGQFRAKLTTTMVGSWVMFLNVKMATGESFRKEFNFEINRE